MTFRARLRNIIGALRGRLHSNLTKSDVSDLSPSSYSHSTYDSSSSKEDDTLLCGDAADDFLKIRAQIEDYRIPIKSAEDEGDEEVDDGHKEDPSPKQPTSFFVADPSRTSSSRVSSRSSFIAPSRHHHDYSEPIPPAYGDLLDWCPSSIQRHTAVTCPMYDEYRDSTSLCASPAPLIRRYDSEDEIGLGISQWPEDLLEEEEAERVTRPRCSYLDVSDTSSDDWDEEELGWTEMAGTIHYTRVHKYEVEHSKEQETYDQGF